MNLGELCIDAAKSLICEDRRSLPEVTEIRIEYQLTDRPSSAASTSCRKLDRLDVTSCRHYHSTGLHKETHSRCLLHYCLNMYSINLTATDPTPQQLQLAHRSKCSACTASDTQCCMHEDHATVVYYYEVSVTLALIACAVKNVVLIAVLHSCLKQAALLVQLCTMWNDTSKGMPETIKQLSKHWPQR
eukprot:9834-Heterococcus_DN1.PRE.4